MSSYLKDRQRWQPEEDAILCAYVTECGPQNWQLISERTGKRLDRDPKSCEERWKNYLKPGIKRGPLTDEEQQLVIKLQTKYGNKWKRIAAQVPGRTAKRLGKWWEVYKERKLKENKKLLGLAATGNGDSIITAEEEMHLPVVAPIFSRPFLSSTPDLLHGNGDPALSTSGNDHHFGNNTSGASNAETLSENEPLLTLGPSSLVQNAAKQCSPEMVATSGVTMPKWIPKELELQIASTLNESAVESSLSLSSSFDDGVDCLDPASVSSDNRESSVIQVFELFKQLKDQRNNWILERTKVWSKFRELKRQLDSERIEKQRQKIEEVGIKVRALKDEETRFLRKVEQDYEELISNLERDAELKENKIMEVWTIKHEKLVHAYERYTISGPHRV